MTARAKPSARRLLWRRVERMIVTVHRWLGIVACLFFAVWFVSGIVMVYVNYPRLNDSEALEHLPTLEQSAVSIEPGDALKIAGLESFPKEVRLQMAGTRPIYVLDPWRGELQSVFADSGEPVGGLDAEQAAEIAGAYLPESSVAATGVIRRDQWSFPSRLNAHRPLHRFKFSDAAGTGVYVSDRTGEVVLDTDSTERFWNWFAGIPHLLDFPSLRDNDAIFWRPVMLLATSLGTVVAISGFYLGIVRMSLRKRYMDRAITPYRSWMKWHHLLGVLGGVFLIAWVASAWLYLRPNHLLERTPIPIPHLQDYAGHSDPDFPVTLSELKRNFPNDTRRVRFKWIGGEPKAIAEGGGGPIQVLGRGGLAAGLSPPEIQAAAASLVPETADVQVTLLTVPDEYWHTFGGTYRTFPMLRLRYNDSRQQWFHIDPTTGDVINTLDEGDRAFRWLFNGLHKIDFLSLQRLGPVRDLVVWILMGAGFAVSVTGIVIGWKRLRKPVRRRAKPIST